MLAWSLLLVCGPWLHRWRDRTVAGMAVAGKSSRVCDGYEVFLVAARARILTAPRCPAARPVELL